MHFLLSTGRRSAVFRPRVGQLLNQKRNADPASWIGRPRAVTMLVQHSAYALLWGENALLFSPEGKQTVILFSRAALGGSKRL